MAFRICLFASQIALYFISLSVADRALSMIKNDHYFTVKKIVFKHLLLCHRTTHVVTVFGVLLAEEDTEFGVFMTTETEVASLT